MKNEYIIELKDGKVNPIILEKLNKDFYGMKDCRLRISAEKFRSKRSDSQNAYLHHLFTEFTKGLNSLGNEFKTIEVKEMLKAKFALTDIVNEATGECIGQRIKGTSEMNKTEVSEFIDEIIRYGADMFGIKLNYPNEKIMLDFEKADREYNN